MEVKQIKIKASSRFYLYLLNLHHLPERFQIALYYRAEHVYFFDNQPAVLLSIPYFAECDFVNRSDIGARYDG